MKLLHALIVTVLLYVIASFAFVVPAKADDTLLKKTWTDVQSNSSFHLFDNLTSGTFYDFKEHVMMAGGTTEIYTYKKLSFDLGIVKSIDSPTSTVSPTDVLPIVGVKLKIGSVLDAIPALHALAGQMGLQQGLLQYVTAGGWAARDFDLHETRYGGYAGLVATFGGSPAKVAAVPVTPAP